MCETIQAQVAVIIGGAQGLGLACVKALLGKGTKVLIGDIEEDIGQSIEKSLQSQYGKENVMFMKCDVTSPDQIQGLMRGCLSRYGRLDIFSCFAGIVNEVNWRKCLNVNLSGSIEASYAAVKLMSKAEGGHGGVVILISSLLALNPFVCMPVYSASKAALIAFTRACAEEPSVHTTGVRFCVICPAEFDTQLARNVPCDKYPILYEEIYSSRPYNIVGEPSLVGKAFLRCVEEPELNGKSLLVYKNNDGDHIEQLEYTKPVL